MFRRLRALMARMLGESVGLEGGEPPSATHLASTMAAAQPVAATVSPGDIAAAADAATELAEPALSRAASHETPDEALDLSAVNALVEAGKIERAISIIEHALRTHPDTEKAVVLDELRTIRRSRKRLQRRPRDPYAHFELGRALFAQECGQEALKHLEQACRLRPTWLEPHLLRAYELHWEKRWKEAEAAYQAVLSLDPNHSVARRGLNAVRLGQPPDALMLGEISA